MQCSHCDQEHPEDTQFCPMTGKKIRIPGFCQQCGKPVDTKWRHCTHCGRKLIQADELPFQQETQALGDSQAQISIPELSKSINLDEPIAQDKKTKFNGAQIKIETGARSPSAGDTISDRGKDISSPPTQLQFTEIGQSQETQKQPINQSQNPLSEAVSAGAFAGAGAGLAAHLFAGGRLTFPIWIVAYVLVLANVKNKLVATIVFVIIVSLVTFIYGLIDPAK
jgi:hypothetical protein